MNTRLPAWCARVDAGCGHITESLMTHCSTRTSFSTLTVVLESSNLGGTEVTMQLDTAGNRSDRTTHITKDAALAAAAAATLLVAGCSTAGASVTTKAGTVTAMSCGSASSWTCGTYTATSTSDGSGSAAPPSPLRLVFISGSSADFVDDCNQTRAALTVTDNHASLTSPINLGVGCSTAVIEPFLGRLLSDHAVLVRHGKTVTLQAEVGAIVFRQDQHS